MLPTKFQNAVSAARTCCPDLTFASLEHVLRHSAVDGGQILRDRIKFQQSPGLSSLRRRRRTTEAPDTRRLLSLEIRKRQRLKIQIWKTEQVNFFIFFFTFFCRDRSQVRELFYWSASRHWDCFYTGQSPDVQSPR